MFFLFDFYKAFDKRVIHVYIRSNLMYTVKHRIYSSREKSAVYIYIYMYTKIFFIDKKVIVHIYLYKTHFFTVFNILCGSQKCSNLMLEKCANINPNLQIGPDGPGCKAPQNFSKFG